MSQEQYLYERLEWSTRHGGNADMIVSICTIVAALFAYGLVV